MHTYTNQQVAEEFQRYADYIGEHIDSFNRVDSLPLIGVKTELRARKIAAEILLPVQKQFALAAQQYGIEAKRESQPPIDTMESDNGPSENSGWSI